MILVLGGFSTLRIYINCKDEIDLDCNKWSTEMIQRSVTHLCRNIYLMPTFPREKPRTSPTPTPTAWTARPLSGSTCLSGASRRLTTWGCSSGKMTDCYKYYKVRSLSYFQCPDYLPAAVERQQVNNIFIVPLSSRSPPHSLVERLLFWLLVLRLLAVSRVEREGKGLNMIADDQSNSQIKTFS